MNTNGNTTPVSGDVDDTQAARRWLKALVTMHVLAAAAWLVLPFVLAWAPPYVDLLGYPLVEHAIATRAAMVCLSRRTHLWHLRTRIVASSAMGTASVDRARRGGGHPRRAVACGWYRCAGPDVYGRDRTEHGSGRALFIIAVDVGLNVLALPFGIVSLVGWQFLRRGAGSRGFRGVSAIPVHVKWVLAGALALGWVLGALWMATAWQRAVREIEGMGGRVGFSARRTDVSLV